MTNDEIAHFEGLERHQVFNTKYPTETAAVDGYSAKQTIMDDAVVTIDTGMKVESEGGTTDTKTVTAKKKSMSRLIITYCEGAVILANAAGNSALANKLNKSMTYLFKAGKSDSVTNAKALRKLFFDNKTIVTNVKAADLLLIDTAIEGFDSIKDLPIIDIKEKKSHGTDAIATAIVAGCKASQDQYGLFHSKYSVSAVDMTEELRLLHTPIFTGYRKTPLVVEIVDDETGEAIDESAISKKINKGKDTKSFKSKKGVVPFDTHKQGDTEYTIDAPGFVSMKKVVSVIRHQDNVVVVRMKKSPPAPQKGI